MTDVDAKLSENHEDGPFEDAHEIFVIELPVERGADDFEESIERDQIPTWMPSAISGSAERS